MPHARLLIVEDESIVAQDVRVSLEQLGYGVCAVVPTGEQALVEADAHKPDLVLMDIVLAGEMNGVQAADLIRRRFEIPVVYLTAHSDSDTLEHARITEPFGYILKPFGERELQTVVEMALYRAGSEAERRRAENQLKRERDFSTAILETAGALVVVLDLHGRIVQFNRACERTTGYSSEEVTGRRFWDLFVTADEIDAVKAVFEDLRAGQFPNEHENNWKTRDGRLRRIAWSNTCLLDADGAVEYVVATGVDVTERRQAEEALRAGREDLNRAQAVAHTGSWRLNVQRDELLWSDETHRIFGIPRGTPMTYETFLAAIHPEDREGVDQQWQAALRGERYDLEHRIVVDGAVKWVRERAELEFDDEGTLLGGFGTVQDITARKRAEEALRESRAQLAVRNEIAQAFLTTPDDEVYNEVLPIVLKALESEYGLLGYIDEDGALVCPSLTKDVWQQCQLPDKTTVFPREKWGGLWGEALKGGKTLWSNEPLSVPDGHIPLARAMAAPIIYGAEPLGLLVVANRPSDYGAREQSFLETIAGYVAPILSARLRIDREAQARQRAESALRNLRRRFQSERSFAGIVGTTPSMLELFETIREVADADVPVLIQGESGTGKELVAAAIHNEGHRSERPFIVVNCGALPETLLESELFGHVKGAFTGAIREKKGRFELADGGTIFLDEVGELTPPVQVKLLRVLQEGAFERVGGEVTVRVNVRIVSATNRDLAGAVAEGRFREDLFYRLCVLPVSIPPLRERRDDIPLLAAHILEQIAGTETGKRLGISERALDLLMAQEWPGNVRQLQNAIHFAATKCKGEIIGPEHLTVIVPKSTRASTPVVARKTRQRKLDPDSVTRALEETKGNKKKAAELLGVSRATFYRFLDHAEETTSV